jgi:uncharacterized protein YjbI with pentapeptide repeats
MTQKTTAKRPAKATVVAPRLAGKTIAFAGRFYEPYRSVEDAFGRQIKSEGGKLVADVTPALDYLVVGRTRGHTDAEKKAERLNQTQGASIQILDENTFRQLFALTRDEAIVLLRGGEEGVARWQRLRELCLWRGIPPIDLSGINLRGVNLHLVNLQQVILDGADLRNADLSHVCFGELRNVKLDGARLQSAFVQHAHDCPFHKADLSDAHINPADYKGCDFTAAKLPRVFGGYTQAADVIFREADLTSAGLERSNFQRADFTGANLSEARLNKCDFTGAILKSTDLRKADLTDAMLVKRKADLTDAMLVNADLSGADLRKTILAGADFAGANIEGANFTGANLTGARVAGLDAAQAAGLDPAAASAGGKIGTNIRELEKITRQSRRLETFALIEMKDHPVELKVTAYHNGRWIGTYTGTPGMGSHGGATSFSAAMIDLARRWTNGTLRLASVTAKSSKGPLGGKQLRRLAAAAWCEACGVPVRSETELEEKLRAGKADQDELREQMLQELRGGPAGIKRWNDRRGRIVPMNCLSLDSRRKAGNFRRVDLSNLDLSGADLTGLDFQGAIFDGSSLVKANCDYGDFRKASFRNARLTNARCGIAKFSGADFTGASLYQTQLRVSTFSSAVFAGADLRGTDFGYADLRGADLSGADLSKAKFERTKYNEKTRLPPGFKPLEGMEWKGGSLPPGTVSATLMTASTGAIDFATLMERLPRMVDAARLGKALQMLKKDRFQLYAEVKDNALVGVVKSQSDPDLVYSCRLSADGFFGCCTQNLRSCGGLGGTLCKHLLVLLIGLAKAGGLDPAAADAWVNASKKHRPSLDKETMGETFLRYKGAEAGEVDWRPTETIPEDYYAL